MQELVQQNTMINGDKVAKYSPEEISRMVGISFNIGEKITGESRIHYQPYQRKIIEYENRNRIERISRTRRVTEYQERKVVEEVPREVTKTQYIAVQKRIQYVKEIIPEKTVEMVAVPKTKKRIEYVSVQKKVIKAPEQIIKSLMNNQAVVVNTNPISTPVSMPVVQAPAQVQAPLSTLAPAFVTFTHNAPSFEFSNVNLQQDTLNVNMNANVNANMNNNNGSSRVKDVETANSSFV